MDQPLLTARDAIELGDGRSLGYSTTGPVDGVPVIYFHGAIGPPPVCGHALAAEIVSSRIRYVMVDRPGFGGSDPDPGRSLLDFAADVRELADVLGFARFSVLGVSCGAPYALACAWAMPDRVAAVASVSTVPPSFSPRRSHGTVPWLRLPLMFLRGRPGAARAILDRVVELARDHTWALRALFSIVVRGDSRRDGERRELAMRRFLATLARGSQPMIDDFLISCAPWEFDPAEIRPRIHLWHGVRDPFVPVKSAQQLSRRFADCHLRVPEEGHLFLRERIGDVLGPLVAAAAGEERRISERLAA